MNEKPVVIAVIVLLCVAPSFTFWYVSQGGQTEIVTVEQFIEVSDIQDVLFTPNFSPKNVLIEWIDRSNSSIHIVIYSFTLDEVSDALITAHRRGVDVRILFEETQISRYSEYGKLKNAGVPVRWDSNPRLMHIKYMIVDGQVVLVGSLNYSASADQYNDEVLLVIEGDTPQVFSQHFEKIWRTGV